MRETDARGRIRLKSVSRGRDTKQAVSITRFGGFVSNPSQARLTKSGLVSRQYHVSLTKSHASPKVSITRGGGIYTPRVRLTTGGKKNTPAPHTRHDADASCCLGTTDAGRAQSDHEHRHTRQRSERSPETRAQTLTLAACHRQQTAARCASARRDGVGDGAALADSRRGHERKATYWLPTRDEGATMLDELASGALNGTQAQRLFGHGSEVEWLP